MATEPQTAASTAPSWSDSPIENELPTYRAISSWAIASLVLGVTSLVSFASLNFVIASVGAIVTGALAQRAIRRYPDLMTGSGLANFGIAIGLITGLSAPTVTLVQHSIIARNAKVYADQLALALQDQGMEEAFWLAQHPGIRDGTTPKRLMEEINASPEQEMSSDSRLGAFRTMSSRVASSDQQHVHVDAIESKGYSGITPYANVRVVLDGPGTEIFPALQFALIQVEGAYIDGKREWYVKDVVFPYEAGTRSSVVESAHGHDH